MLGERDAEVSRRLSQVHEVEVDSLVELRPVEGEVEFAGRVEKHYFVLRIEKQVPPPKSVSKAVAQRKARVLLRKLLRKQVRLVRVWHRSATLLLLLLGTLLAPYALELLC